MKTLERIMLVDDDESTNFINKLFLKEAKASDDIVVFQNGKEALAYLSVGDHTVNLILLDINMPIMNGWEFLEHFEELKLGRNLKTMVVMLSSSVNSDDKIRAEEFDTVKKFVNKPLFKETIDDILTFFSSNVEL